MPNDSLMFPKPERKKKKESRSVLRKDGHNYIFLEGILDKTYMRLKIYRNAGGEAQWVDEKDPESVIDLKPAMCQGCTEPHAISWNGHGAPKGEWFHCGKSKGGRRCDGACCALYTCKPYHDAYHARTVHIRRLDK